MDKDRKYVYRDPIVDGFVKFDLPRHQHNEIFKHPKCRIFDTIDAYYREDSIIIEYTTSSVGKVVNTLLLPVSVILYGLNSISETFTAWKRMFNEKKYGKFLKERINKNHYDGNPNEQFLRLEQIFQSEQKHERYV